MEDVGWPVPTREAKDHDRMWQATTSHGMDQYHRSSFEQYRASQANYYKWFEPFKIAMVDTHLRYFHLDRTIMCSECFLSLFQTDFPYFTIRIDITHAESSTSVGCKKHFVSGIWPYGSLMRKCIAVVRSNEA